MTDLSHPLLSYRQRESIGQREIADMVGVSIVQISRIETGSRQPSPQLAQKLGRVTGIPLSELRPDIYPRTGASRMTSAWQSIETAPKDGTILLLFFPDAAQHFKIMTGQWLKFDDSTDEGDWYPIEDGSFDVIPTHWMPLPAPPTGAE